MCGGRPAPVLQEGSSRPRALAQGHPRLEAKLTLRSKDWETRPRSEGPVVEGEKVLTFVTSLENPTSGPTFEEGRGGIFLPPLIMNTWFIIVVFP